ncbi:MAG: mannose-1-phosphate guanylyltransferase [Promethearchaeota archaeon]
MKHIPVILAGGKGERFWPLSRVTKPKQNLPLMSENPMILDTYLRLKSFDEFFIVANQNLCDSFRLVLPSHVGYIIEPTARNTAPAIGLACAYLQQKFGDCVVFFETADHYYSDSSEYLSEVQKACLFAENNDKIVLIGISPDSPHTGYGYIEQGDDIKKSFYNVHQFKEKPDLETAKMYLDKGTFSWNSGLFIAKTSVLLKEISQNLPDLGNILSELQENNFEEPSLSQLFQKTLKISIDYGVMEKSSETVLLKSTMSWDDIGDFNAISRHFSGDSQGNILRGNGNLESIDASENIIISDKLVALIGVENLVIIETDDALLVCNRDETQKIREIVQKLNEKYR